MEFLLNKIVNFNRLNVIGIYRNDDTTIFHILRLQKKKENLEIIEQTTYEDFDILTNKLDVKTPLVLLLDGKGIVNKKIVLKDEKDIEWLKNLDYNTTHFTSYTTPDSQFLSFCRNHVLEEYFNLIQQKGYQIIDFYIGSIISVLGNDFLNTSKIIANENVLYFEENMLANVIKKDESYELQNYHISEKSITNFHLPLYCAAINFFIKQESITKSSYKENDKEEIVYKKAFEIIGLSMVVLFFSLLLISYFSIQYLINKNASLNLEISYATKSYDLIKKLEEEKDNKYKILNEMGATSKNFISFYNYQIASLTPIEIKLSNMEFAPLRKEIKKTEKPEFEFKSIILKGQTFDEVSFNSWIAILKNEKWISKLEIISVKRDKKNDIFFELKITITDV